MAKVDFLIYSEISFGLDLALQELSEHWESIPVAGFARSSEPNPITHFLSC